MRLISSVTQEKRHKRKWMANSRGKPQAETNTVCCQYLVWLGRNSVEKRLIRPRGVRKPTGPREKVLGRPLSRAKYQKYLFKSPQEGVSGCGIHGTVSERESREKGRQQ